MATVTGYTATRMKQIEDETVTSGLVDVNGDLILQTRAGTPINAGEVKGEDGDPGPQGPKGDGAPAGSIMAWVIDAIPAGWAECDGGEISRDTDYFTLVGTKYGAGNGTTTVNVPDLRGKTIVGQNIGDPDFGILGGLTGDKEHEHPLSDAGKAATYASAGRVWFKSSSAGGSYTFNRRAVAGTEDVSGTATAGAALMGETDSASSIQPSFTGKYIVKLNGDIGQLDPTVETVLTSRVAAIEANYLPRQIVYFTSSGTFTKGSYPWLKAVRVRVQGGGGGGGGGASGSGNSPGSGGGGGGYAESFITDIASIPASTMITVGAGGAGVTANHGTSGGASSFGSLVQADGGEGGFLRSGSTIASAYGIRGGYGGGGTHGDLLSFGTAGVSGLGAGSIAIGGAGGASHLGGGGAGNTGGAGSGSYAGYDAENYGGGGGGGATNNGGGGNYGGNGAPGVVILELFG